jgi:hypothetical protein
MADGFMTAANVASEQDGYHSARRCSDGGIELVDSAGRSCGVFSSQISIEDLGSDNYRCCWRIQIGRR